MRTPRAIAATAMAFLPILTAIAGAEDWLQFKYDSRHSGDVPQRSVPADLGLIGAVPLTDAIFTAPAITEGHAYVVDGSGVAVCIDASTLRILWKSNSDGGRANCNNVSSPAVAGRYLHFGTMAGSYYVLDRATGDVVKRIECGEPILSAPVVVGDRVYFATLGSRIYALDPDGSIRWTWDFVKEVLKYDGDRWSGEQWCKHKGGKVSWRDQFCCAIDIAAVDGTIVVPVAGSLICLADRGNRAELVASPTVPAYAGSEKPAIFGLSIAEDGAAYVQWHRRDNTGRVEIMQFDETQRGAEYVPGTLTEINRPGSLSFCSVSIRGRDVYRCRPEEGLGFCKHSPGTEQTQYLGGYPSITSPLLIGDKGIYGGLDGCLYVVPLSGKGKIWSFRTAFGDAISAPVAVCDGRIYFGCEDGYLYVLGQGGKAMLPSKDLQIRKIRSPLTSPLADAKYDWFTNFGNQASTNSNDQGLKPPFKINWIRRYEGTFKHMPVCGGGRMYTHTAEGQIFAVEQETGRLLWRRYWPGVHVSFTGPLYHRERLLVPQAGFDRSLIRCLDAATGELQWEAPFTGSPSWSRQQPPVVCGNLAVYAFGSGRYAPQGTEKAYVHKGKPVESPDGAEVMSWIYTHDNPYYPVDNKPLIRTWDVETGKVAWSIDFSQFGSGGNDAGVCLMDGTLYYSTFFGYSPTRKDGQPKARGLTAAIEPSTGQVIWLTTKYYVTAGCTISAENGRLYLGGYNPPNEKTSNRHVYCLDAENGSLVWRSDPVGKAVNVVTIGRDSVFVHGSTGQPSHVIDKDTGKLRSTFDKKYACTRFSLSEPYVIGPNMDMIDISAGNKLISSGPCIDARECVGGVVSNGRIFYTSQANGLQVSQLYGAEAK